ncbi:MAG: PfkB family carbohydrate kinase [Fibrobacteria bacterium]
MIDNKDILKAAEAIAARKTVMRTKKFLVGFDGFVDEIIHAVGTRKNNHEYERIGTITEFAARVASAAGKSANIELVPIVEKLGGNGPLMAMAAAGMGAQVTCIGMLGYPEIHSVFKPLKNICKVVSVGIPGHTDALEFNDGKLMLGKLNTIKDMCWERLLEVVGEAVLRELFFLSDMVACTNWTMLTEMGEIIENMIRMVPDGCKVKFFFDFADPEKRSREDLAQVLDQLQRLNKKADVILGLNLREAEQVSEVLEIPEKPEESAKGVEAAALRVKEKLGLSGVVVHAIKYAGAALGKDSAGIEGPFCASPKLSTGAGDHFNGGFCGGIMADLPVVDALYCGVGASGWYVRNARSPTSEDIVGLLRSWVAGTLQG